MAGPIPRARWSKADGQWCARFTVRGKRRYFALGDDEDAATSQLQHLLIRYRRVKAEPPPLPTVPGQFRGHNYSLCLFGAGFCVRRMSPRHTARRASLPVLPIVFYHISCVASTGFFTRNEAASEGFADTIINSILMHGVP